MRDAVKPFWYLLVSRPKFGSGFAAELCDLVLVDEAPACGRVIAGENFETVFILNGNIKKPGWGVRNALPREVRFYTGVHISANLFDSIGQGEVLGQAWPEQAQSKGEQGEPVETRIHTERF